MYVLCKARPRKRAKRSLIGCVLLQIEVLTYKSMMGEYIVYYRGKIVGGICDDRFLVKPVKSAIAYMPNAKHELLCDGAKEVLLVDDVDNI